MQNKNICIRVRGVMGAGKTTFAKLLAKRLDLPFHEEPLSKYKYLEQAYKDPDKYSFISQKDMFNHILDQSCLPGVTDQTLEDIVFVFSKAMLTEDQQAKMVDLYTKELSNNKRILKPLFTIFILPSPTEIIERIRKRQRVMESQVSLEFIEKLDKFLKEDIQNYPIEKIFIANNSFTLDEEIENAVKKTYAMSI